MNRIYKVIWSKAKNCYVVASELAKRHTKSPAGTTHVALKAGVLACVLAMNLYASPVMAAGPNVTYDDNTYATITLEGERVGVGTKITNLADGELSASSTDAVTGGQLYAVEQTIQTLQSGIATNSSTIANAQTAISNLRSKVATVESTLNTVKTQVEAGFNVTIGGARVKNVNPDSNYINFIAGDNITLTAENGGVKIEADGAPADATVASGQTNAISGDTAYNELRPASNGNYIATASTTAANLQALDDAIKANEDAMDDKANVALDNITDAGKTVVRDLAKEAVKVVDGTNTTVTEGADGVAKTYAVNVTANGAVASGDTGIVTGGTVYDALHAEARPAADGNYITTANTAGANLTALDTAIKANEDAMDGKANVALDNITDAGKTVIQDATNVVSGDSIIDVTSATASGVKTYTVKANISADGQITSGDTRLVIGNTVYTEVRPASDGNYIATANTTGANLTALDNAVKANEDAIDDINDALDNKANVGLDNITAAGETVVKGLAKQAVNVTGTNAATVTKTDVNGVDTYTVDVTANGAVASGNTGLVDGGTVYDALQAEARPASDGNYITAANTAGANLTALDTAIKANEDAMDGKANVALDNITDAGKTVIQDATNVVSGDTIIDVTSATANGVKTYTVKANISANGQVVSGDTGLVSGDTVYTEVRPASDGNYIATANTTGANLTALDDAVKANEDAIDDINDALDNKANVSLDNITAAGETVVKDLAKQAVNVVGTNAATVTKTDVNGVDTYTVDVTATGAVASGDTGLVDGDTVFDALQDQKDEIDDALDTKANKDASNVAANTAEWGAAIGTGAVVSGNGELVTGGTVYDALQAEARPAADGNYITAANTAGANLTALDTAIKANEDAMDGKANVALDNITDAGKTVIQDATNVASGDTIIDVTSATANGVKTYTVKANITANGQVASGDTGLVSGDTVYNEVRPASDGNYIATANTTGANLTALDNAVKANEDAIDDLDDGKANIELDNINDDGKTVVRDLAKEAVKVVAGDHTTVTEGTDGNAKTYAVNVTADGVVASGDTGIVDGGTVFDALQDQRDEIDDELDTKANKDASNVASNTAEWGAAIGTGAVEFGNGELVTGGTVYDALQAEARPAADGNYITTANTAGANLTALDTAVKANEDAIADLDNGKANVALDNITDDGKTVVRDLAKEAVKVVAGEHTTVTEGTDGNAKTYAVNVTTDGAVASGNTGVVSGGTVYDAIQDYDETKGMHYVSINSNVSSAGSNYANDGASGQNAIAIGAEASAEGARSVALGYKSKAEGEDSFAFGQGAVSKGKGTVAFTGGNEAYGEYSTAFGFNNVAGISADGTETFVGATAMGTGTEARASGATAMGNWTIAEGQNSVAMGNGAHTFEDAKASLAMGQDTQAAGSGSFAGGTDSIAGGFNAFAFGDSAEAAGDYASALGNTAKAIGDNSVALGFNSQAYGDYSVAILGGRTGDGTFEFDDTTGTYDVDVTDNAIGAFAAGYGSVAMKDYTVAIGRHATVENDKGIALGEDANVVADSSAALGYASVATEDDTISVGHKAGDADYNGGTYSSDLNRRIVNVAEGVEDTDAVNVGQMNTALDDKANTDLDNITDDGKAVVRDLAKEAVKVVDGTNTTVTEGTDGDAKTYAVDVVVDGVVASGNAGIVDGGTVFDALQAETRPAADGNYIAANNTAGDNLTALDTAVKTNADAISALDDGKANIGLDNIDNNGKEVIRELAKDSINVVGGTNADVVKTDGTVDTYTVNVAADGAVIANDNRIVTGGTVYEALNDAVTNINNALDGKADTNLQNITEEGNRTIQMIARDAVKVEGRNHITSELVYDADGNAIYRVEDVVDGAVEDGNTGLVDGGTVFDAIKDAKDEVNDATDTKLADYALKDASNVTDANAWGQAIAKGAVAADDVRAVSGDTVFKALKDNADNTQQVLDGKANISLDNLNTDGKNVLQQSAITAVKVADGENTTVSSEYDADGNVTYKVKANATGTIAQGDAGLVDGGTVYEALKAQEDATADALDGKANVDASNVTDAEAWGEKIATGAVAQGDVRAVSGDTVYNLANDLRNEAAGALDGKANVALDNITDAGKDVITGLTDVVSANDYAEVTSNIDREGKKTYTIEVKADGQVAQGNTGIVNGDTVYNAIQDAKDETADVLDGKANVGLDNISEEGKDVITGLTDVAAGENIVVESNVDRTGKKTYTVSAPANGQIAQGDTGLVSGGTVYDALQTQTDAMADALDGKANVALDNITDEGKDVITGLTDVVSGDNYSKVESAVDREGKKTYTVTTNVDGVVASGNTGIVNGDTVYNAIQNAQAETADALDGKANVALDNITEAGKDVITGLTDVVAGENIVVDSVVDREGKKTYTVSASADGQIASGDTGLVSGGTVYDALQTQADATADALDGKANVALDNITDEGKDVITGLTDVVSGDDYSKVESAVDREGKKTYTVTTNVDGAVASGDTGIVTGGTVYDALKDATDTVNERIDTVEQTVQDGLDSKANVGLDNLSDAGKDVLKTSAQEAVKLADGANTTVTSEYDANGNITYKVEANATGAVEANNTGLVDGGTVYDALQAQSDGIDEKLDTKANKDASNVADQAEAWGTAIGTGAVADGDGKLVTGDTVFHAMEGRMATDLSNMDEAGKDVITGLIEVEAGNEHTEVTSAVSRDGIKTFTVSALVDGEVAENNNSAVTGGTVYEALKEQSDATAEALDGKANVGLDNLTDAGTTVLQQSAIAAVKVADGENTTVSSEYDANGNVTYKVNAPADGAIAQGDTGLVSGGTVYDALQTQADAMADALDGKANVALDNITDEGKDVITGLTDVVSGDDYSKVESAVDREGKKTYTVTTNVDGAVAEGDTGIVTGGTVYDALKDATDAVNERIDTVEQTVQDGLDGKANVGLDNLSDAGKNVLKTSAQEAVKVADGANTAVTSEYDANGNITYKVEAKATGAVEANNTGLVDGGTVYDALQAQSEGVDEKLDTKANKDASNVAEHAEAWGTAIGTGAVADGDGKLVTGDTVFHAMEGRMATDLSNMDEAGKDVITGLIEVEAGNEHTEVTSAVSRDGIKTFTVSALVDGEVAENNNGAVTGGKVYEALKEQSDATVEALDGKANVGLDNLSDAGTKVLQQSAIKSVKVADGENTTVSSEYDADGNITYKVKANADGAIEQGNTGLVDGGTVYEALQSAADETQEALDEKANVDASNVTDSAAWAEKLGTGEVAENNAELVTGGTVYEALKEQADNTAEALDGKANVGLDNLTDAGTKVLQQSAITAVKTEAGEHTIVTPSYDADGNISYKIDVKADGAVESGNTELVTGGTVYDALEQANSNTQQALDGKANIALDNISEAGKDVITGLTEVVSGDNYINVEATTERTGKKVYTVTANIDGAVESGNEGLVTGGQVADAIGEAKSDVEEQIETLTDNVNEAIDTKANRDMDNLTDAGVRAVKTLAQESVQVEAGDHAAVESTFDQNGNKIYTVSALADGAIDKNNEGLVSGGMVFDETRPAVDGEYISKDSSAGENLSALDEALKETNEAIASAADSAVKYDSEQKGKVTLEGEDGTKITNLKDADLTDESTDAVTGRQLKATNDIVETHSEDIEGLKDMSNLTDTGKDTVKELAKDAVGVEAGDRATVTSAEVNGKMVYTVSANNDGVIEAGNTDLVSGNTVYEALQDKADTNLGNLTAEGKDVITGLTEVVAGENVRVDSTKSDGKVTYTVNALGNGIVEDGNTGLVTGDTVFNALSEAQEATEEALEGKANVDMDNLTDAGKTAVKTLAKEAVKVKGEGYAEVTKEEEDGNYIYTVNVKADGVIEANNTGLVTGGMVANETKVQLDGFAVRKDYTAGANLMALDNALKDVAEKADALDANTVKYDTNTKARITLEGEDGTKIDNVKAGALTSDSMEAVNGSQLFATNENVAANAEAIEGIKATIGTMEEGEYIDDRNTVGENLKALDDAIVQQAAETEEALAGKANTDMDNLTDTGKQNVKDLAKEAVTVSAGDHVSIVTTEENGNIDYQVNVVVDGKVEEGNTGIVDGGTVYEAIQEVAADVDEKLEGKANTNLDNITDEGKQVIRDTMAEDLAGKANVDASNVTDANAWGEKIATGEIAEGEVRAVNGDTVNSALNTMSEEFDEKLGEKADKDLGNITPDGEQKIKDVMADDLAEKADKDLGNITDEGKDVIRELTQNSVKLEDGETTRVSSRIDADGSKIYKVEALAEGEIEAGDNRAVSGNTMAEFIDKEIGKVKDGNHVQADKPIAENINALDTAVGKVEDGYFVDSNLSMGENINVLDEQVARNTKGIASLYDNQIMIKKEMREGLAKSAALAGLHPFENDTDQKWNIAAAMGGYRGEHAAAIGLFYRPSDRVMVNAGTTITDSDNMYNVGVSVALDKGSGMSKSQMKQRIGNLEDIIRKMAHKIDSLEANQLALTGMTKEFPDVPANHWAHNAVVNLHGSDIVQGYPDGEFKGAKPMTRYEYAEMLFNALEKGKTLPKEVVSEYSQELEQIRQNRSK